ncbi:hypothetical protein ABDX87_24930 [Pseudomonas abietaniphila]|uniref:hypothetical protein n=1 Tax=Pseudomonas abietaniphila TaxID=89065 RepID=UPI003217CDB0
MKKFLASAIKCYKEDEVLTVALGDDAEDPDNFLIITRLDDEDNASVDDGIGLLTDQAKYEKSGVIAKVILRLNKLEIVVKPEFTEFYGCSSIVAEFLPNDNELSINYLSLKKALHHMFSGSQVDFIV